MLIQKLEVYPAFEVNINDIVYSIYPDGQITWIMPNQNRLPPVIGQIINRIPRLITEAQQEIIDKQAAGDDIDIHAEDSYNFDR